MQKLEEIKILLYNQMIRWHFVDWVLNTWSTLIVTRVFFGVRSLLSTRLAIYHSNMSGIRLRRDHIIKTHTPCIARGIMWFHECRALGPFWRLLIWRCKSSKSRCNYSKLNQKYVTRHCKVHLANAELAGDGCIIWFLQEVLMLFGTNKLRSLKNAKLARFVT